ncbi:MAG: LuxR family transcriptional regulator [Bacteroidetes bacterium]|nr:MAG: LuxR family transcriptional regulator [Bacteroidota bacterium]MBL1145746.1 LuxR family transcriptional regulator [Bacteroidota bacterium]NOG58540.1 hypothetical protein [Bacteroidota bacterium]
MSDSITLDISNFLKTIKKKLAHLEKIPKSLDSFKHAFLQNGQAMYVANYKKGEVTYSRNIEKVLGYYPEEFEKLLPTQNLLHPKQKVIVSLLINQGISSVVTGVFNPDNIKFVLLYKVKHKNGTYRSILRQTGVFETDSNNRMITMYSFITDVTGLMDTDKVEWKLEGVDNELEQNIIHEVYKLGKNIFSERELEFLTELKKGKTSKEIAAKFNNSRHTIDTHRRKLLKKSHCKNTQELLGFAESLTI